MSKLKISQQKKLWFERIMAITATVNLVLVFFDLSYVPWRDFYFRRVPAITRLYDSTKGIEPHRDTKKYLEAVAGLEKQVIQTGLVSPQVKAKLADIRFLSQEMIETNPFASAGKSGTLEKIKNRMREHVRQKSAKAAFNTFWSQEYLSKNGWNQEIDFFNQKIRPGIAINYYRKIDENGGFLNNFWIIDLPFVILFATELLGRTFLIKRRYSHLSWLEAVLWRWYDLLLLIPIWQWLRVIPVTVRLDQAKLIDFYVIRRQIHQGLLANFAEEITEIVIIQVINQIQGSIQRGEMTRWLLQSDNVRSYIDINNINEIEAITGLLIKTLVNQVLPKIQPEVNAILCHSIEMACQQLPGYNNILMLPGLGKAQTQISEQLATQITNNIYAALASTIKDPVAAKLSTQLIEKFTTSLTSEIQQKQVLAEIQSLLNDFLEEVKINYIQRLSQDDIDKILEETRKMRTQSSSSLSIRK
ncbi:hypothetical protein MEN41_15300 [Dolichospermum sp. ST_con]|nr:hypothetical protein [Dolichospermum sp. ST_con]MDD1420844.1 hypothetical protein [Dolichospermum sp. ST_sed1]MDD1423042.1 hypothetical protein [Dolichospermum sp. ST_sed9]MDD1432478.1 hypothetical protein [Dolichospermum sp. ST_sed6]MDD1436311.1 hypothetical protein [Dolichospermum sp. ST_sed10]MDD1442402.1 hypothetical protein [Dolichospermum sp. ST_sed3]MDD1447839.1 hypothetical protein [Dolichospermum sp. ST_sed8]MDD1453460.1 hypothetical protein [Dolichospermum sp. ST_sed7]MDD146215